MIVFSIAFAAVLVILGRIGEIGLAVDAFTTAGIDFFAVATTTCLLGVILVGLVFFFDGTNANTSPIGFLPGLSRRAMVGLEQPLHQQGFLRAYCNSARCFGALFIGCCLLVC